MISGETLEFLEILPKAAGPLLSALLSLLLLLSSFYWHKYSCLPLAPESWLLTPMNSLMQFPAQWQKHLCQRYVEVKWADSDVEKGIVRFFLAAIISLKCSETSNLGSWTGPGWEQILIAEICCSRSIYSMRSKTAAATPWKLSFPCASSCQRCPLVPWWPWHNCPSVDTCRQSAFPYTERVGK